MRLCQRRRQLWRWPSNTSKRVWPTWSKWDTGFSATIPRTHGIQDLSRGLICFFLQTGFPSRNDSPSCVYSRVDFDSDMDFNSFFNCKYCLIALKIRSLSSLVALFNLFLFVLNSFSSAAGKNGEERMLHCSAGGFPDSSRMVTVSSRQSYRYGRYHM